MHPNIIKEEFKHAKRRVNEASSDFPRPRTDKAASRQERLCRNTKESEETLSNTLQIAPKHVAPQVGVDVSSLG